MTRNKTEIELIEEFSLYWEAQNFSLFGIRITMGDWSKMHYSTNEESEDELEKVFSTMTHFKKRWTELNPWGFDACISVEYIGKKEIGFYSIEMEM